MESCAQRVRRLRKNFNTYMDLIHDKADYISLMVHALYVQVRNCPTCKGDMYHRPLVTFRDFVNDIEPCTRCESGVTALEQTFKEKLAKGDLVK